MKNILLIALFTALFASTVSAAATHGPVCGPDLKVVVTPKKVWFVHDETPLKFFTVQVRDAAGKVLIEKAFDRKNGDWSVDIAALPQGKYSVAVGSEVVKRFEK